VLEPRDGSRGRASALPRSSCPSKTARAGLVCGLGHRHFFGSRPSWTLPRTGEGRRDETLRRRGDACAAHSAQWASGHAAQHQRGVRRGSGRPAAPPVRRARGLCGGAGPPARPRAARRGRAPRDAHDAGGRRARGAVRAAGSAVRRLRPGDRPRGAPGGPRPKRDAGGDDPPRRAPLL